LIARLFDDENHFQLISYIITILLTFVEKNIRSFHDVPVGGSSALKLPLEKNIKRDAVKKKE
jgi:hypothetical protein